MAEAAQCTPASPATDVSLSIIIIIIIIIVIIMEFTPKRQKRGLGKEAERQELRDTGSGATPESLCSA